MCLLNLSWDPLEEKLHVNWLDCLLIFSDIQSKPGPGKDLEFELDLDLWWWGWFDYLPDCGVMSAPDVTMSPMSGWRGHGWQQTSAHPSQQQNTTSINIDWKYCSCVPLSSQPSSSSECPLKRDMMSTLCAISLRPCQSHLLETIRVQQTKHLRPFFSLQQNRNKLAFCFRSRTYPRHYGTTGGNMQNQKAAVGINFRL